MAAYRHNGNLENPDLAFPYMATQMLPLALGILTLLAGLSATMSSASSDAIAGVTIFVRDIYEMIFRRVPDANRVVFLSRVALAFTTGAALLMALTADNIIGYIKDMIALFITGMCVCGVLGRLWPRYNAPGAIASLIGAFATALTFKFQTTWDAYWGGSVIPALLISMVAGTIVSLTTSPDKLSQEEVVEYLAKRRESMSNDQTEADTTTEG